MGCSLDLFTKRGIMRDLTIEHDDQGWVVFEHGEYEETSVLAGQPRRSFLDAFQELEDAKTAYPEAEVIEGSSRIPGFNATLPMSPPSWFDSTAAGERWDEDY